ncbi:MAG: 4Fe-4S binding protein [Desulfobacterales bacterium]|nr:4Fe-4S binding protein [Desulfobacterales bacterium]
MALFPPRQTDEKRCTGCGLCEDICMSKPVMRGLPPTGIFKNSVNKPNNSKFEQMPIFQ